MKPPEFVHAPARQRPGEGSLRSQQCTTVRSPPHGGRVPSRGGPPAPRAGSMLSCAQSCTQEQRDVCAEHHTVSMPFHAPTLRPCTAALATADPRAPTEHIGGERAHAQVRAASHDATLLAGLVVVSSTSAHMKDQPVLEVEEPRRIADRNTLRSRATASALRSVICRAGPRAGASWSFASVVTTIRTLY